jgi:sugar/nucleoside kinase (ribokinase family)
MASPRALVCGHVTLDRYGAALLPGGSAYYAGHAYRALGAVSTVATSAGADFPRSALEGLAAIVAPSPRTTRFENRYDEAGRRSQMVSAVANGVDPSGLPPACRSVDVLHLAPVVGEVSLGAWRRAVSARIVGVGVQGFVRAVQPDGAVSQPRWEFDPAELDGVAAACLGEDDLVGQGDLVGRLVAAVPLVVLTHGRAGCDVIARGRASRRVGVHPSREVDPTGAGDVFAAAFFLGLARGADPIDAARLAAAAASIVVEARAGEALGRLAEARQRVTAVTAEAPAAPFPPTR